MPLELLACLPVRLRDIYRHTPAHLLRLSRITRLGTRLAKLTEDAAKDVDVKIRNAHIGVASLRHQLDGLRAADARYPDRRMRLLQRPRPRVDIAKEVVLAVPEKRSGFRPGLDDKIERFPEALACEGRVHLIIEILRPTADHHAGDEPAVAHDVEHGELFRHAQGRVVERQA